MAFSFNQSGGNALSLNVGGEVPEIETESLGFSALGPGGAEGPKKLKLLPSPWPSDNLPPASATLISVASKRGLLAAAGPDTLVLSSTQSVRKAFEEKAGSDDVISTFVPDITTTVPRLRHVAFSSHEDFLIVSPEKGGLIVYSVESLLKQDKNTERHEISTDQIAIRALLPNPSEKLEHIITVVLESGKLCLVDALTQEIQTIREDGVTCAACSVKGKAVVAGLQDGSAAMYMNTGDLRGTIPRPPGVKESWSVSAIYWLNNDEFLFIHSPTNASADGDVMTEGNFYHFVRTDKSLSSFSFHKFAYEPLYSALEAPARNPPPRFSVMRLRNWEPDLDDILIVTGSHTTEVMVVTSSSKAIAPDQQTCNEYTLTGLIDSRKAQIPRMALGEEGDSVPIGEALDLSSKEKIPRPIPMIEEINKSPFPLPAYLLLTHQGLLMAWWVVWNRSIESNKPYPGLTMLGESAESNAVSSQTIDQASLASPKTATPASTQSTSPFGRPSAFDSAGTSLPFGKPATPQFGATAFGSSTPAFGKPAQPAFGKPAQPSFGAASAIGSSGGTGLGAAGGLGNKPSPWASASQTTATQSQSNPFAAAAGGSSGFAKFGGGSAFSSFGSSSAGQSFGSFGQQSTPSGAPNGFKGLSTEPSFGSTVTVGSGNTGSTLPSWASNTPAQKGGLFGQQTTSSFGSTKESDMSDADEENRQRDEATPTPQAPPPQPKGLFGLSDGGFKLGSTFKGDGTAKDDGPKPPAPSSSSLFGGDFASALGGNVPKPPITPMKQGEKESESQNFSTTPATLPKPQSTLFPGFSSSKGSVTPKAPTPAVKEKSPEPEEAPLPPDFVTSKPAKSAEEDLPPLAGSPAIKVEVPSSPVESSNLDEDEDEEDDEDGFSVEEQEGEEETEETEEPSPSDAVRRPRPAPAWNLQASVNQSPRIFPAAPTPPVIKSGTSSVSGRSTSPPRPPMFGQVSRPPTSQLAQGGTTLFGQPPHKGIFGQTNQAAPPSTGISKSSVFAPPHNRSKDNLRSPSPVRAVSTSALGTRREAFVAPGASLSSSVQQLSKPPTPQPRVSDLEDDEDERIRNELARAIEPSRTLDQFIAHHDYAGKALTKTGHAAQIELLYRDINSMVDTLGLNSRSLKGFINYHQKPQRKGKLTRDMLEEAEEQGEEGSWYGNWSLCEIEELKGLENALEHELDEGRVQDVLDKLSQLARLLREKAKLMTRLNDIRRQIISRKDPDKVEAIKKAPLPKELADGQKALRTDYGRLLTLLNQAEEAAVLLRSRLASHHAENGKAGVVPTVDAVKKTIVKMTNLAEKKNNDIVLLESQLRKIGLAEPSRPTSSSSARVGTPTRRSRGPRGGAQSPFATPPTNRSRMSLSELNRRALTPDVDSTPSKGYGLHYKPDDGSAGKELATLGDIVDDNIDNLRETARRRKKVADGLKKALMERGVKTTKVN